MKNVKIEGFQSSLYSCFYIAQVSETDYISSSVKSLKAGKKKGLDFWRKIVAQEFTHHRYKFDYVVRVLCSNETKATHHPMDLIGSLIADRTNSIYTNSIVRKTRTTKKIASMSFAGRKKEMENVYVSSTKLNLKNKRVLIIDDITTSKITLKEVLRAIRKHCPTVKLFSYCLCKSSKNVEANEEFYE